MLSLKNVILDQQYIESLFIRYPRNVVIKIDSTKYACIAPISFCSDIECLYLKL